MAEGTIPEEIRRFILISIGSVPHLEAILMLRAAPAEDWTAQALAGRLYLPEKTAAELLAELASAGILAATGAEAPAYRYRPASPDLAAIIDATAGVYARDLVGVTDLIHSKTGKKAQIFADAFKIRKDS